MATYSVWVGGESPWSRSYTAEFGCQDLSPEQVKRWSDEDGELLLDEISERVNRWDEEEDFDENDIPHRYEIENGCLGSGAFTDQTFGVMNNEDDSVLGMWEVEDLIHEEPSRLGHPSISVDYREYGCDDGETTIAYSYTYKGGYSGEIELPDDEPFDINKVTVSVLDLEGIGRIVTGINYGSEYVEMLDEGDGKSCDFYVIQEGEVYTI